MTSSAPLTDSFLHFLREAEPGSFGPTDASARHDLDSARRMTTGERLAALNELLLALTALHPMQPISHEPIRMVGEPKL